MALDGNALGNAIADELAITDDAARADWRRVGQQIVSHFQRFAVVNVSVATTIQAGALAVGVMGGPGSAPVTGSTTGSGSGSIA